MGRLFTSKKLQFKTHLSQSSIDLVVLKKIDMLDINESGQWLAFLWLAKNLAILWLAKNSIFLLTEDYFGTIQFLPIKLLKIVASVKI